MLNQFKKNDIYLYKSFLTINIVAISTNNYNKFFSKHKKNYVDTKAEKQNFEKILQIRFHVKFKKKTNKFSLY